MRSEIIAVACHKGGSSKTTTSINLAVGLARASWRTLLVDVDAQANSTSQFLDEDTVEYDLFSVIKERVDVRKAILPTRIDGLSVLPSTLALARLDQELISMHRREEQIREALEPVTDDYDAIVMDLSPNLGATVIAALAAATSLIVPTDASRWGRRGVSLFLEWSDDLRAAKVLSADLLGVLLTKYESGTRIGRELRAELGSSGLPTFETVVPKRTAAERMVTNKILLGDPDADEELGTAYVAFVLEVIERVNEVRARRGRHAKEA